VRPGAAWRRVACLAVVASVCLLASLADAVDKRSRLLELQEAAHFRAVGRFNVAGRRFCTATLVSAREIVTAAHCLFHPRTGKPVATSEMRFVAGLYLGKYAALRGVENAAIPPTYQHDGENSATAIAADVALVRLDAAVTPDAVEPLGLGVWSDEEPLSIVSYARDRAFAPAVMADCPAAALQPGVLTLGCPSNFGASGSPILLDFAGRPLIVGVTSAIRPDRTRTRWFTLSARVDQARLDDLRRILSDRPWTGAAPD
jgi:protease YdgD